MLDETEFVELLRSGEPEVVLEVRRWIRSTVLGSRRWQSTEIDDLEQEILLALLEALDAGRFKGESRLETYVRSFARFRSTDRIRAASRRQWVDLDEQPLVSTAPTPFEEVSAHEEAAIARQVVAMLPESCRAIWSLILQGLSYREIGHRTGLAEGATRVRAHRCRQQALELRRRLLAREPM